MTVFSNRLRAGAAAFGFILVAGCGHSGDVPMKAICVEAYASPGVLRVQDFGDIEIASPTGAFLRKQRREYSDDSETSIPGVPSSAEKWLNKYQHGLPEWQKYSDSKRPGAMLRWLSAPLSLLANQYDADVKSEIIESATTFAEYCWEKIADDPGRYLTAAPTETRAYANVCYASGSAFAVSHEGYLLTNAHLVSDDYMDAETVEACVAPDVDRILAALTTEFGEEPRPDTKQMVWISLDSWLAAQTTAKARFKEARVVLDSLVKEQANRKLLIEPHVDDPNLRIRNISVHAEVVGPPGDVFPGKDVAILKVDLQDELICLPLGDSDLVPDHTPIHALGFPGAATGGDLEGEMTEDAKYRVITNPGKLDTRLTMKGGPSGDQWQGFHMDALINQGDSGGPVLDDSGYVVAMNVAGNTQAAGQNIAIPINIAKVFLANIKVKPLVGAGSEHWRRGQQLFGQKDYAGALAEFEEVKGMQQSSYILEMQNQCRRLGNLSGDAN